MISATYYVRCDHPIPCYPNDPDGDYCEAEFSIEQMGSLDPQDILRQFFSRGWLIRLDQRRPGRVGNLHYCPKHRKDHE